ncbi:hypothetical protein Hanom_Chr14g01252651 [Helianthus anomalus]
MNSLKPQGLFLANHFDDVDILLIKIIHLWAPNYSLCYLHTRSLSLQSKNPNILLFLQ